MPREQLRQETEQRILRAAEPVFAEAGYAGATMAALAAAASLPKANLHYYFHTKEALYRAVLDNILTVWLSATDRIVPDGDPARAFSHYIRTKMTLSRLRPQASKVFANEILRGAPQLHSVLGGALRSLVAEKSRVIEGWIAQGLMDPVEPRHLFFAIWAMTQTYADFDVQIRAVLDVDRLGDREFSAGTALIERLVLRGCGVRPAG
ncbi:MAG: TetR family transcriptional regulator C-terminal domain-containing protein [Acetobacteraceae bacterium]|nr:TetR family transcriptional regulator C-terminal domain-containing protein [Acetobacteraceae bacterium]